MDVQKRFIPRLFAALLAVGAAACSGEEAPAACQNGATSCTSSADCGGFACESGCCRGSCDNDTQCATGFRCSGGKCESAAQNHCDSSADCEGRTDGLLRCDNSAGGTFECVECLVDSHCSADNSRACQDKRCVAREGGCADDRDCQNAGTTENPTRHCNRQTRTCVGCLQDSQCFGGNVCVANTCKPANQGCTSDAGCRAPTPYCRAADQTCVQCLSSTTCGAGRKCERNVCVAAGCRADGDCAASPASPRCDAASGQCVECLFDGDCEQGYRCTDRKCAASGCTNDAACRTADPSRPFCLVADGNCVACRRDADCGDASLKCSANACIPRTTACASDADCRTSPASPRCWAGACVACLEQVDCDAGEYCEDRACKAGCLGDANCAAPTPKCDTAAKACVACLADGDCASGRLCRENRCIAGCASNADCAGSTAGKVCDTAARACVQCLSATDCAAGQQCDRNQCVGGTPSGGDPACGVDDACAAGSYCHAEGARKICRKLCDPYAPACASDKACAWIGYTGAGSPAGLCLPKNGRGAPGATCQNSLECENDLLCLPSSAVQGADGRWQTTSTCRRLCNPAGSAAACGGGNSCHTLPVYLSPDSGELLTLGACLPASSTYGEPCNSDYSADGYGSSEADCGPDMTCGPNALLADSTLRVSFCQYPVGEGEADATCTSGSECLTGDCLGGVQRCNTSCHWSSDCRRWSESAYDAGYRCLPYYWSGIDPDSGERVLTSATGACVPTCVSDADCSGAGRFCMLTPSYENSGQYWSGFYAACYHQLGTPGGPQKRSGQPCRADGECESGYCVTNGRADATDGYCFGTCDKSRPASEQCDAAHGVFCGIRRLSTPLSSVGAVGLKLNDGADGLSGTSDDAYGQAWVCNGQLCEADGDCAGLSADSARPRACRLTLQVNGYTTAFGASSTLRTTCEPRVGTKGAGASCTSGAECASGDCITFSSGRRGCFGACKVAADCATGSSCTSVNYGTSTAPISIRSCLRTQ